MKSTTPDPIRFGTVGSPQTAPQSGTPAAIEYIRLLGMDHLEIAWVQSVRVSDDSCLTIKAAAEKHHVTLSVHAPYYINLNSQTAELMAKSDERLLAAARKGWLAGAQDIVFHPGSYHNQPPDQVYERARQKLLEIREQLNEEGVNVTLRPETMGKSAMFGSLEEVVALSRDIPGVLPCIDFAHLYARTGSGGMNTVKEFRSIFDTIRRELGPEALGKFHCHMSGIAYSAKGERNHIPLNECAQIYRDLLQVMIDYNVQGTMAVEAPEPFHVADALTLQATYRRLRSRMDGELDESGDES